MAETAKLALRDRGGQVVGTLEISALPRSSSAPEDRTADPARRRSEPAIQLREASSYRYSIDLRPPGDVRLEPAELFDGDDSSGRSGRLHTRQYVGDVLVSAISDDDGSIASGAVLVKAVKLEHEREYQHMLREIADLAAEAVLQGFAPASTSFEISSSSPPRVLYQQFAILQARLADEELLDAIAEVVHRPQRDWVRETEWRPPGRPLRGGGDIARALTTPGRRVPLISPIGALETLPSSIASYRSEETVDTIPNRFVKFALSRWRELAERLGDVLSSRAGAAYGVRGITAVDGVVETLDEILSEPFFREIGRLQELPTANQVLLKREGYRQIFSTFALIESSLDLRLELEDAIHPSQRNIASLYEYWTFLKLVAVLGEACDDPEASLRLFEQDGDGLSLGLKRGRESELQWRVAVAGRRLMVCVYFNRAFRSTDDPDSDGSWSRAMVPDASVLIRPDEGRTRVEPERDLDVWLHFDAKYKLEWSSAQFERAETEREELELARREEERERQASSRRDDLLKMHAYRDAIRRSAGAYVLFPGTPGALEFRQYMELIPGLGAFPLRPGDDSGSAALRRFIADVLLHAADQATAEERHRFWRSRILYELPSSTLGHSVDFLDRPPADTPVLLGSVRDQDLWEWTDTVHRYVVPLAGNGDGLSVHAEELSAPVVLLSGGGQALLSERHGPWTLVDEKDLEALNHPHPSDAPAVLCELLPLEKQPPWLTELPLTEHLARAKNPGEPVLTSWALLMYEAPDLDVRDRVRPRTSDARRDQQGTRRASLGRPDQASAPPPTGQHFGR
jgi:predicted component of viral defense system (DUF524 family)